ncbi:MAG TPA: HD domain-containing protein [Roseiflexaceae bacterium]|nr:HD domain-containing protein [Roseiflexaceae bacterium]
MPTAADWPSWEAQFAGFVERAGPAADAAHDTEHIRRVVANARALAAQEQADLAVVLPAAWLHDCVSVPKSSPLRSQASRLAGRAALEFLQSIDYPAQYLPAIRHAIEAHSFSANISPQTREAMVVQDADRLDSLGAIGLARCLMLSAAMGRRLYDPLEPIPITRSLDEQANALDHFYAKLFQLAEHMTTQAGRSEALKRTAFLHAFVDQLREEIQT